MTQANIALCRLSHPWNTELSINHQYFYPMGWLVETLCPFLIDLVAAAPTAEMISCQCGRIP